MFDYLKSEAVKAIRQSYQVLSQETNLSPQNEVVNKSLTHLVRTLTQCQDPKMGAALLNAPELREALEQLPGLCGQAECEMEKFWARKLIAEQDNRLENFWYYPEYCELCSAEQALLEPAKTFQRISFLGAGALPVTAFLLARHCAGTKVVCVDFDAEACDLSMQLSRRLNLQNSVDIRYIDALSYRPAEDELVICASLLQNGNKVYQRLQNHSCALMVRNAEGAYQFLYKPAQLPASGFREVAKTTPDARRINTTHYFERSANVG